MKENKKNGDVGLLRLMEFVLKEFDKISVSSILQNLERPVRRRSQAQNQ